MFLHGYLLFSGLSLLTLYQKKKEDQTIPTETLTAEDNLCRVRWSKEKKKAKIQNNSFFSFRCQNCAYCLHLFYCEIYEDA